MIKKFFTVAAASTFLMVAAGAHAQDATTQQNNATGTAPMTTTDPNAPAATTGTTNSAASTTNSTDTQETASTYLTEQGENQLSANEYIGSTVYNSKNESIGDINDLIIEKNGGVVAAVVGVGGFLGIGEKNVAVPMSNIMASQKEDGTDLKLTTNETADTLKNAPEFKTLDQTHTASDTMAPAGDTTGTVPNTDTQGGAMTPAPAAPADPAAGTTTQQ